MAAKTPMISPGVRVNVVDQSQYTAIANVPDNAFAIVGGAQFGPINIPTLITSASQFIQLFSTPIDVAGLTAINTVNAGGTIYYCRFASADAKAMTAELPGTNETGVADLTLTATYKGTLLEGAWKAVVAASSASNSFKLSITRTVGSNDPITVITETELSLDPTAANYFITWNNDFFTLKIKDPSAVPTAITANTYEITAGTNGIADTRDGNATAVKAALDVFSDRETYNIMYLTAPDYSITAGVATEMVTIADTRKDCIVQIDHDPDPTTATADTVITALKGYATTPYVGLWAGLGGYISDPYNNNVDRLVPVSAYLIPALAREYTLYPVWTAPASAAYLDLSLITKLDKIWSQADRDKLYAANINPITNYKGLGYTSMGQKSGQTSKSAMDRLNVVQLVNYIRTGIERISVGFLFAPIDEETFSSWVYRVGNFLDTIRNRRGLYDYVVKMDWETVTPDAINNNLMPGIVLIKPTKVAEFIDVDLIIRNYSDSMTI